MEANDHQHRYLVIGGKYHFSLVVVLMRDCFQNNLSVKMQKSGHLLETWPPGSWISYLLGPWVACSLRPRYLCIGGRDVRPRPSQVSFWGLLVVVWTPCSVQAASGPSQMVFTDDAPIEFATRGVAVVSTDWNQSAFTCGQAPPSPHTHSFCVLTCEMRVMMLLHPQMTGGLIRCYI